MDGRPPRKRVIGHSKMEGTLITPTDSKKRNGLERFSERIVLVSGLGVLVIALLVSYDVLLRFFFNEPQLFVDDLTSFLLVPIIFLGAGPTFYRGGHIRVDLLTNHLRPKAQRALRVITLFIGLALLMLIVYETLVSTWSAFETGRVSAVMNYPLWVAMIFIPLGLAIMAFFLFVGLMIEIQAKGGHRAESPQDVSREISH
jgi:C4-dicarboxylate transporter, DctQ subunit